MSDLTKDLANVVLLSNTASDGPFRGLAFMFDDNVERDESWCVCNANSNLTGAEAEKPDALFLAESANFIRTHHATIQQNAEATKRLRALERAMAETIYGHTAHGFKMRADEILREGERHDQD